MTPVHFLLVDDLEENLLSLEALLRREGLVLLKARSGDEALELLLHHDVALALVDVQMPGLDGFELAELMRGNERTRRIPIIFVTAGSADAQRRFRGYGTGAVDFIQKPIEPDILRSKAEVFFELYRQRHQIASQRDKLEAQAKALELAARRKDEFLLTLTHDLTLQKDAKAQQDMLLREINHRIKNLFSLTGGLITLSARNAGSVDELASDLKSRLQALADAHQLTLPDLASDHSLDTSSTTVKAVLKAILAPYVSGEETRVAVLGTDTAISSKALASFALLLHEFTTNAAKYGALAKPSGRLVIELTRGAEELRMDWHETTEPQSVKKSDREGFGTSLEKAVLRGLGASLQKDWRNDGLRILITVPLGNLG